MSCDGGTTHHDRQRVGHTAKRASNRDEDLVERLDTLEEAEDTERAQQLQLVKGTQISICSVAREVKRGEAQDEARGDVSVLGEAIVVRTCGVAVKIMGCLSSQQPLQPSHRSAIRLRQPLQPLHALQPLQPLQPSHPSAIRLRQTLCHRGLLLHGLHLHGLHLHGLLLYMVCS